MYQPFAIETTLQKTLPSVVITEVKHVPITKRKRRPKPVEQSGSGKKRSAKKSINSTKKTKVQQLFALRNSKNV